LNNLAILQFGNFHGKPAHPASVANRQVSLITKFVRLVAEHLTGRDAPLTISNMFLSINNLVVESFAPGAKP